MPPKKKSKTEKSKKKSQSQKQRQSITVNINQPKSRPRRRAQSRYSVGGGSVSGTPATVIQATPTSSTIEGLQFRLDTQKKLIEDQRDAMKDFRDRVDTTYQNQQQTRLLEQDAFVNENTPLSFDYFSKAPSVDGSERSIPSGLVDDKNRSDYNTDQSIPLGEMTDRFKSVEKERNEALEREKKMKEEFDVQASKKKKGEKEIGRLKQELGDEQEAKIDIELKLEALQKKTTKEPVFTEKQFEEKKKTIRQKYNKQVKESIAKAREEEKELASKTLEEERLKIRADEQSLATKSIEDFKKQNKAVKFKGLDKATGYGEKKDNLRPMESQSVGAGQLFETVKTKGRPPEFDATKSSQGSLEFERKFKISGAEDLPSFYGATTRDYGEQKGRGVIARARDINAPLKKVNVSSGENLERASGGGLPAEEPDEFADVEFS